MSDTSLGVQGAAADAVAPMRTAARIAAVALFVVATAIGARISVPVPLTPVPMTLQTLFVLLSGALLGPALGATAQLAYLGAGIAGIPVFVGGAGLAYLLGPTGGYLLAFPLAAFLAGIVADRVPRRGLPGAALLFVALLAASLVVLLGGSAWLGAITGDVRGAFALGFVPFLAGDVLKVALTALLAWRGRDRVLRLL
ncbi:MAG TPA: biotin transporter BioY [Longimicrobiales bacterium]|nr:biotin transporter BioY [Longimicrobiales bacterium]